MWRRWLERTLSAHSAEDYAARRAERDRPEAAPMEDEADSSSLALPVAPFLGFEGLPAPQIERGGGVGRAGSSP
jgi:hypothetical protein